MRAARAALLPALLLVASACGGPAGPSPLPPDGQARPGITYDLSALAVAGSSWSVQEAGCGTVTAAGLYTAPGCSPSTVDLQVCHVVAAAPDGKTASVEVDVADPVVSVSVCVQVPPGSTTCSPGPVTVQPGGQVQAVGQGVTFCGRTVPLP